MIDYESYNKIIGYLEKSDLEKLRTYVEKEKEKYYLKNAKTALESYIRGIGFYDYIDEDRIIITDISSLYILNSDELLTQNQRKNKNILSRGQSTFLLEQLKKYEQLPYSKVGIIKNPVPGKKQVFSEDGKVYHFFTQQSFNYSKKFLGEQVLYSICNNTPACLAESAKGKGLILGLR